MTPSPLQFMYVIRVSWLISQWFDMALPALSLRICTKDVSLDCVKILQCNGKHHHSSPDDIIIYTLLASQAGSGKEKMASFE